MIIKKGPSGQDICDIRDKHSESQQDQKEKKKKTTLTFERMGIKYKAKTHLQDIFDVLLGAWESETNWPLPGVEAAAGWLQSLQMPAFLEP